jgi:LPS export ABC transporter protein LptC
MKHGFVRMRHEFFILLYSTLLLAACNDSKRVEQTYTEADTGVEVGREVEILYSDSATVRVRVTGPVLHYFTANDNPRQEFPEGVKIDFLDTDQSVRSTLTAKTATRKQDMGIVTARDSVVMTTQKQEKLETEELIWDEKTKKVRTDKFVKVTKPGEIIYGYGLEAEQDFSYWKITVPKGRIKVEQLNDL